MLPTRHRTQLGLWLRTVGTVFCVLWLADCQNSSNGSRSRRLEFGDLNQADRIDVIGIGGQAIATIDDRERILAAAMFIEQYHEGWIDYWSGPRAPRLLLEFFKGSRSLGHFGISRSYLVSGSLSRDTPSAEIEAFAKNLRLPWPPNQ